LPGHLPGNRKVPGLMLSWGFLLLLFPWGKKLYFHSQLLNQEHIVLCKQVTAEKQLSIADVVIPVKKSQRKITPAPT